MFYFLEGTIGRNMLKSILVRAWEEKRRAGEKASVVLENTHTHTHTHTYLEKAMATHSSALAWKIPRTGEPGELQSMGSQSQTRLSDFTSLTSYFITGEGNGNPLQYSCLKNLMDRGAWRAMVHGVTESQTRLK